MMRHRGLALLLALAVPALLEAQQPSPTIVAGPPAISVSSTGEARVTPDRAWVTVGVMSRAATAAAASAANARTQRAILDTLRAMGFQPEQLTTSGYNVSPDMRYNQQTGESTITGYTVRNSVRVEVRRIEQVGPVIDAALKKGSNEIQGIGFFSSRADSARREALANAVALARADAEVLARAAGGTLGELLELSTTGMFRPAPMMDMAMARAGKAEGAQTPIEPGEQTVQAMVVARWRFVGR